MPVSSLGWQRSSVSLLGAIEKLSGYNPGQPGQGGWTTAPPQVSSNLNYSVILIKPHFHLSPGGGALHSGFRCVHGLCASKWSSTAGGRIHVSVVPALRETAVTTAPAPCQGSLVTEAHELMSQHLQPVQVSDCLHDPAGPADEQVKWPGSKGSVGLQAPALGASASLSRRAGVGGLGTPMLVGVSIETVLQWGCCPMSSFLQAQKLERLRSRGATGQPVSEPTCYRNPHCTYTSLYYLPAQPERGAG